MSFEKTKMAARRRIVEYATSWLTPPPILEAVDPAVHWQGSGYPGANRLTGPFPPHWCAAFALHMLAETIGVIALGEVLIPGKGFLLTPEGLPALKTTRDPLPGDIGYRESGQHHRVITWKRGSVVESIDGNSGWPSAVRRQQHIFGTPGEHYFSIDPFLEATGHV